MEMSRLLVVVKITMTTCASVKKPELRYQNDTDWYVKTMASFDNNAQNQNDKYTRHSEKNLIKGNRIHQIECHKKPELKIPIGDYDQ